MLTTSRLVSDRTCTNPLLVTRFFLKNRCGGEDVHKIMLFAVSQEQFDLTQIVKR